jgi:hypothetical protein
MSEPAVYPTPSREILGMVFQELFNLASGTPVVRLTRVRLEDQVSRVPKPSVHACVINYEGGEYIACTKNDVVISPKDYNTDYDEFHLTAKGAKTNGILFPDKTKATKRKRKKL